MTRIGNNDPLPGGQTLIETWRRRPGKERSQTALADKVGVTQAYISALEVRKRRPSAAVCRQLAKATRLPLAEIRDDFGLSAE